MATLRIATTFVAVLCLGPSACSNQGESVSLSDAGVDLGALGGSGGNGGSGGKNAGGGGAGGANGNGGNSSAVGTGGAGTVAAGGTGTGGGVVTGGIGSGGGVVTGGTGTGGARTGGSVVAGGIGTGGVRSGGSVATGGGAGTGEMGSGGSVVTGGSGAGSVRTGGTVSTGGIATGGTGTGGTSTGGSAGTGGIATGGTSTSGTTSTGSGTVGTPWDWSGVVGTGQSLAVGDHGTPAKSMTQPYNNLQLSTGTLSWPVDPTSSVLKMVPLIEPIGRPATSYPSSWPTNISGETPHSAMANQITALVQAAAGRDYIGVHGEVGENGQCMTYLKKNATQSGVNGRAYQASLIETQAITRLAQAAGKTYGVGAIIITHGECDAGNAKYESDLYQLWSDYNTDLPAITGQTQKLQLIVSQQNSTNDHSASTLAQWKIGVDHAADVVCSGPKYQYPTATDHTHLVTDGYRELGEKYGQVYVQRVVLGNGWQPLQPTTAERAGTVITVHYHVPAPPMVWDTTFSAPHPSSNEWKQGKGFEVSTSSGTKVTISSVAISGDAVTITCASDPGAGATVGYAMVADATAMSTPWAGTVRWGQLRDSDPFVGAITKQAQPNYGVAFEMSLP